MLWVIFDPLPLSARRAEQDRFRHRASEAKLLPVGVPVLARADPFAVVAWDRGSVGAGLYSP